MSEPECTYIGRCNSSRCPKHGLTDVQRAAARAFLYYEDFELTELEVDEIRNALAANRASHGATQRKPGGGS